MSERLGGVPDFTHDIDARPPELPLGIVIPGTILMYVAMGIIYPIVGIIAAKDFLARKFSHNKAEALPKPAQHWQDSIDQV